MDIQDMRIFARVAAVQNLSAVGTRARPDPRHHLQAHSGPGGRAFAPGCSTAPPARSASPRRAPLSSSHVERILSEIEAARASVDDKVSKPKGQAQDRGSGVPRSPLCGAGPVRVRALLPGDRCPGRPARPAGQPAGGRLRHGHSHRRAVGFLADCQASGAGPPRDRGIAAYLARAGRPSRPRISRGISVWCWARPASGRSCGTALKARFAYRERCDPTTASFSAARPLTASDLSASSELEILCELRSGKLVQVLSEYEVATNAALWALYPSAKHLLPRMRAILDFLADWFRNTRNEAGIPGIEAVATVAQGGTAAPRSRIQAGAR